MCIIAYKPANKAFPDWNVLENCFTNNGDGAGFMYSYENNVVIRKGFETFKAFKTALLHAREITGDNVPYVMHFRIATQGYKKTFTHPFPLSGNMKNLEKLKYNCNIGVAHNGIISMTSDGSLNYSDTMKYITDYLSLIIRNYSWYKDDRTKTLIARMIGNSRLAVLDKNNHCELIGAGWIEENGIFYSNNSYSYKKAVYTYSNWELNCSSKDKLKNHWEHYKNKFTGKYDFYSTYCPYYDDGDSSYCSKCSREGLCKAKTKYSSSSYADWDYYD